MAGAEDSLRSGHVPVKKIDYGCSDLDRLLATLRCKNLVSRVVVRGFILFAVEDHEA